MSNWNLFDTCYVLIQSVDVECYHAFVGLVRRIVIMLLASQGLSPRLEMNAVNDAAGLGLVRSTF